MPCPTCNHTAVMPFAPKWTRCRRCGTLEHTEEDGRTETIVPTIWKTERVADLPDKIVYMIRGELVSRAAEYVLSKNSELYRRLATYDKSSEEPQTGKADDVTTKENYRGRLLSPFTHTLLSNRNHIVTDAVGSIVSLCGYGTTASQDADMIAAALNAWFKPVDKPEPARVSATKECLEGFHAALSLAAAIQEAGGSVASVARSLKTMTVPEFVAEVAARNGIRFCYEKAKEG